jgi:peroxiredoxin
MSIQIGSVAPSFNLKDTDGNEVSLQSLQDKNVVVLFFPLAFTGVCTKELCLIRDTMKEYENLDANVVAISVDSFFTLNEFKKRENYNFPLLSDFNKEAATAYGAIYEDFFGYNGVAKRSAFVVDKKGIVRYAEVLELAKELPNFEAVRQTLADIQ